MAEFRDTASFIPLLYFCFTRSSVQLSRGIHTLYLHIRHKGPFTFTCNIKPLEAKQTFQVLAPAFLPDLVEGKLFSKHITFSVNNFHGALWLKVTKVSIVKNSCPGHQFTMKILEEDKDFSIVPGQVRPIKILLEYKNRKETISDEGVCSEIELILKISTSKGQDQKLAINLRSRRLSESFLFSFLDHDGSVQHGAAIAPLKGCDSGICPVLLTLHGTSMVSV